MAPALVLLAILVTAGAVVAVCAREPRLAALGIFVVLTGSAYVVEPLPGVVALAARLVGSVLAGYLVWISLRGAPPPTSGWRIGWPGAAAVGVVAFAIGWLAAGSLGATLASLSAEGPSVGAATALADGSFVPRAALGAALALTALALGPVLLGRDVLRLGLGLLLLLSAAGLLRNALSAGSDGIVELGLAVLTALAGASVATVVARAIRSGGDLELRTSGRGVSEVRHHPVDDAHPRRAAEPAIQASAELPPGGDEPDDGAGRP